MSYRLISLCALLLLGACGHQTETPPLASTPAPTVEEQPAKLFDAQRNVLEQAKAVDPVQQEAERRKELEQQTQ